MSNNETARHPDIRKIVVQTEETLKERNKPVDGKSKVTVAAVIRNPFAGQDIDDLEPLYDLGSNISGLLTKKGVAALGVSPNDIVSYGREVLRDEYY